MSNLPTVPFDELQRMGMAIAKSGLFGAKSPEQAIALMLLAQAEGRHPAAAAQDYDIIQGKAAKKAEAMLRDFIGAGGTVEWHQLDDTVADATFSHAAGGKVRIKWDMARANRAGITGKDNWKKYPRAMLRSRCVSEGCKTVYPVATGGMHTPEETEDFARDVTPQSSAESLKQIEDMRKEIIPGIEPKRTPEELFNAMKNVPGGPAELSKIVNNLTAAGHIYHANKLADLLCGLPHTAPPPPLSDDEKFPFD